MEEKARPVTIILLLSRGLLPNFRSVLLFYIPGDEVMLAVINMSCTDGEFVLILPGGVRLSRLIKLRMRKDIFDEENETFPQKKLILENEYDVTWRLNDVLSRLTKTLQSLNNNTIERIRLQK